jgi:cytoskeleton-associated protein 5
MAPVDRESKLNAKTDINSLILPILYDKLNHSHWKERKEGLDELAKLVFSSNFSIQGNLDAELVSTLKNRISDSNRNLSSQAIDICGDLAISIGKPFERYSRTLTPPLLALLADQKPQMREKVLANLEKIEKAINFSHLLVPISTILLQDQPQIRKDLLMWVLNKELYFKDCEDLELLLKPIFACLQDRNSDVRRLTQKLLEMIAKIIPVKSIKQKAVDMYHGAQLATLEASFEVFREEEINLPGSPKIKKSPAIRISENTSKVKNPSRHLKSATSNSKIESSTDTLNEENLMDLLSIDMKAKDLRAAADRGINKWVFEVPRRDLVELLSDQCRSKFFPDLHALLFSNDHYKDKDFLNGIKQLDSYFCHAIEGDVKMQQVAISNCDLILKYLTIRFFESNTSILIKLLDLLEHFLSILDSAGYLLNEYEAHAFIPFFVNKLGDPKESIRVKLRSILKQLGRVYPVSKLFIFLLKGLESKNSRVRVECLDELASLIQRNGQSVFVPSKSVFLIGGQVGNRDNSVRSSALNAICQIYYTINEEMFPLLSKLSDKEKDLITERIKRLPVKGKDGTIEVTVEAKENLNYVESENQEKKGDELIPATKKIRKEFSLDLDRFDLPNLEPSKFDHQDKLGKLLQSSFKPVSNSIDGGMEERLDIIMSQMAGFDLDQTLEATRLL